mmetsp:Transcript_21342/g.3465  ORF Transcript_21342/g.3465 Transcript_21342/m.3465 type:complete len:95 (-) Transcript_21342:403-687(-)
MITPSPFMMASYSPMDGRQNLRFMYRLDQDLEMKVQAQYMSQNPQESQIQVEVEKSGDDYLASVKASPGMELFALSYIQSVTKRLITGVEILNL